MWQLDRANSAQFIDLRDPDQLQEAYLLFVPASEVYGAMDLVEEPASAERVASMLRVLARESLIANELTGLNWRVTPGYAMDSQAKLATMHHHMPPIPGPGLVVAPTPAGIELFLWGCGGDDRDPVALRNLPAELVNQLDSEVPACPGAATLRQLAGQD